VARSHNLQMCLSRKRSDVWFVATLLAAAVLFTVSASEARADGYVISQPASSSSVMPGQRAVLIYRDGHEDLVISIDLDVRSAPQVPDMAWVIPVPALPEIHVTNGALFDELDRLSAPEIIYQPEGQGARSSGTSAPAPTPSVEVLERNQVGIYDVAVLASQEGNALRDWLRTEGFGIPGAVQPVLDAYLAEQWVFVAMRIAPDADQSEISSSPPIWLSFDAAQMVYPMRLTGVRTTSLALRLYVLWDHRASLDGFTTEFAGDVQVDAPDGAMASTLYRSFYLTKLFDREVTPAEMATDFYPSQAPTDESYRERFVETTVTSRPAPMRVSPAILFGLGGSGLAGLLILIVVSIWLLRRRKRP
jgi:hypothetical protein